MNAEIFKLISHLIEDNRLNREAKSKGFSPTSTEFALQICFTEYILLEERYTKLREMIDDSADEAEIYEK